MNVYIVDDSVILRERLVSMLADLAGLRVVGQASDTQEAMEGIRRLKPDVVILDLHLPGGGGIKVLRYTKQESPTTRVIILTNYDYPQYRNTCFDAGADLFVDKLTEFDRVPALVAQWMTPVEKPITTQP
jgi:DNA-binding NarL/FixJ family response regulator